MRRLQQFLFAVTIVLLGLSCSDNTAGNYGSYVSSDFLGTNNTKYLHKFSIIDSLGKAIEEFVDTVTIKVAVEEKKTGQYEKSIRVDARSTPMVNSRGIEVGSTGSHWYAQSGDTVSLVAYSGVAGMFFPKRGENVLEREDFNFDIPISMKKYLQLKHISSDSVYLSDQKRVVYVFPLSPGKQWRGYNSTYWFKQIRKVDGIETIQTPAGTYTCSKIRTSINSEEFKADEVWYDFVSKEGIILRTLDITLQITTEANPEGVGRAKFYERLELISQN